MRDLEIISHHEMCQREGMMLQRGMYYRPEVPHSVLLMSRRQNAPYQDEMPDESTLIYEGHDIPRRRTDPRDPKTVDQPMFNDFGKLTENGRFYEAATRFKQGKAAPRRVRVYENLRPNIWTYNGTFHLLDAEMRDTGHRKVFKFKLVAVPEESDDSGPPTVDAPQRRLIPSWVKREVFKRDRGRCALCGAQKNLHYDHILPFSRGGSSNTPENIQILCGKHNLQKHANIE